MAAAAFGRAGRDWPAQLIEAWRARRRHCAGTSAAAALRQPVALYYDPRERRGLFATSNGVAWSSRRLAAGNDRVLEDRVLFIAPLLCVTTGNAHNMRKFAVLNTRAIGGGDRRDTRASLPSRIVFD